ncbi:MAG: hypothetical protein PHN71_07825 [Candidatus Cloacimonetes bacterium]|jgi:hypothetical protein|nr:hypothetical protein [Candidatus Cloacimonadota bacterium]MDD2211209.1 hypothetical protein [Candidatus Cloacimonadota bacterium]MDD4231744.1 hypothetical protein [Candidatus Cloacimonadota bacterium]MDY0299326.1 hypothetical protein [Candidatus Cloacimonadaceae bacterium]
MAKILSLRLNYKGKFLDYAKEGKEIKKNFTIGSNKFLQWQILEPSFPDKHLFIQQKGGEYVMQLLPGAQLSVEKGGNAVDSNYLKQNNLLSGNQLVLKKDIKGTLTLAPDWSVDFEYREPWVIVLTPEEKQIVAQYARRARPDAVSRFNRMIVWLVLLLSLVFVVIFDIFLKPEYSYEETVTQKLQTLQGEAQKVKADITEPTGTYVPQAAPAETAETPTTEGTPGGTGTAARGSSALDAAFAGGFDAASTSIAPSLSIVTVQEGFSARRPGGGTGSGTGTGSGAFAGTGGGAGSSFSATSTPVFGDVGSVVSRGPSTAGYSDRPTGAQGTHITGDASRLAPSGKAWGDVLEQQRIAADYAKRNVATFNERDIAGLSESEKAVASSLREQVQDRQAQIMQAYREAQIRQTVSFTITLFINSNGAVRESVVIPAGSYPENFVSKVKSIVDSWKFTVNGEAQYTFPIRLRP